MDEKDEEIRLNVVTREDLEASAQGGDPSALDILGVVLYRGWGEEKNLEEPLRLFKVAGEKGDGACACHVAYMLEHGEGCEADPAQAAEWYAKAAKLGFHCPEARIDTTCWDVGGK
jgi:TPR repeat protein